MNPRVTAWNLVVSALALDGSDGFLHSLRENFRSKSVDWGLVVAMANQLLVTPALWVGLRDKDLAADLPPELREYLEAFHAVNAERNQRLKDQVVAAVRALNGRGVEPVLLKGAAHLFTDTFGDFGARMMGDLDLLVPKDRLATGLAALQSIGYAAGAAGAPKRAEHHHHPPLFRSGDGAAIELHHELLAPVASHLLPTTIAWSQTQRLAAGPLTLRVLSPTCRVFHNLLHSEIVNQNHVRGEVCLRQLHDLVALCRRYGAEVDWPVIRSRMERHGQGEILRSYLYLAHRLLGLSLPEKVRPTWSSAGHLRRCRLGVRWAWVAQGGQLLQRFSAQHISQMTGCPPSLPALTRGRVRYGLYLLKKPFAPAGSHPPSKVVDGHEPL